MLYFIKSQNYLKIGFSQDFETLVNRIESYITHNPEFTLISFTEFGKRSDEKTLHKLLKDYQHHTEWFKNDLEVFQTWDQYINKHNLIPKNCYFTFPQNLDELKNLNYKQVWDSNLLPTIDEVSDKEEIEVTLLKYIGTYKTFSSEDFNRVCKFCSKEIGIKVTKQLLEEYGYIFSEFTDDIVTIKKIKFTNITLQNN